MFPTVRNLTPDDQEWILALFKEHWSADYVVSRGNIHRAKELDGFIVEFEGEKAGLLTYVFWGDECEITTLNSLNPSQGLGQYLLEAVRNKARAEGCKRLWLVTSNDNTRALRFYQRFGFTINAVRLGEIEKARKLKPSIPQLGHNGIPIRDEFELEMILD